MRRLRLPTLPVKAVANAVDAWFARCLAGEGSRQHRVSPCREIECRFVARVLHAGLLQRGGCTVDLHTGRELRAGAEGFLVGIKAYEARFRTLPSLELITAYVSQIKPLVEDDPRRLLLRCWRDETRNSIWTRHPIAAEPGCGVQVRGHHKTGELIVYPPDSAHGYTSPEGALLIVILDAPTERAQAKTAA